MLSLVTHWINLSEKLQMWERMKETVSLLEPRKNSLTFYYIDCLIGILIMVIVCYCKPHITGQYNHLYALNDKGFFIAHLLFAVDMMTCTNLWKGPVENHELAFTPATTNIKYNIDRLMTNCRNAVASRLLVILITSPWHPITVRHSTCRSIQRICEPRRLRRVVWDAWDGIKNQKVPYISTGGIWGGTACPPTLMTRWAEV